MDDRGPTYSNAKQYNLFQKKLKNPTVYQIETYKAYINKYNRLKREMKRIYFKDMMEVNETNIKIHDRYRRKDTLGKITPKTSFP